MKKNLLAYYVIKITDLGVSKRVSDMSAITQATLIGTGNWMAPEIYPDKDKHTKYSSAADIFSLGLLFLSIVEHNPGQKLQARKGMYI